MESIVVDHVLVAERDSHFLMAKPVPLSEEHMGHAAGGVCDNSVNIPEFVAASIDRIMAANLYVAARDDIGGAHRLEPWDRDTLDLLAGDGVILGLLDHLFFAVSLPSLGSYHECRHIGGLKRLETRHGAEELDLVRLGIDIYMVVVEGNQPTKPQPIIFLDR
jgi:hypothetical protein